MNMHAVLRGSAVAAASLILAASPVHAKPHFVHRAAATHKEAAAETLHPTPLAMWETRLRHTGLLEFVLGRLPEPTMQTVPGGVELHWNANVDPRMTGRVRLPQIHDVTNRHDATGTTVSVQLSCDCGANTRRVGRTFVLEIGAAPVQANASDKKSDLDRLRESLQAKLALVNALPPQTASGSSPSAAPADGAATSAAAGAPQAAPRPACRQSFSMDGWAGRGHFVADLRALRTKMAQSNDAPADIAGLAEFYLGNGLAREALAVTTEARNVPAGSDTQHRLLRDADLAWLLMGQSIGAGSVLLTNPPDCDRTDIPLWRALSAAAAGDAEGVARDAQAAAGVLKMLPDRLMQMFAYRIAQGAPDNLLVQQTMADLVRNSPADDPEELADHFLLQARVARYTHHQANEIEFLQHAAQDPVVHAALLARERLAELQSAAETPTGDRAAEVLADFARVYRDTAFGQSAAAVLAERLLRHRDFAAALEVADASAGPWASRDADSRGASLAAEILRRLLVKADVPGLPSASRRLMLYWRYAGYATPGEKGDDIRMSAARLMLAQDMPEAALTVTRQLSPATLATPAGALLQATTEARAGDAAQALTLLQAIPASDETHRIAADALSRLNRFADAAHQFDGAQSVADRLRRASLLYRAKAWPDAADAYAAVVDDPALTGAARDDAMERYAIALALAGRTSVGTVAGATGLAARMFGALPPASQSNEPLVSALSGSLQRAKLIEALLPDAGTGPKPAAAGAKSGS